MQIEIKATVTALAAPAIMLAATFSLAQVLQSTNGVDSRHASETKASATQAAVVLGEEAESGHTLFEKKLRALSWR